MSVVPVCQDCGSENCVPVESGVALTCQQCGVNFTLPAWAVAKGRGKYCGVECYHASRLGRENPALRKRIEKVCPACGKTFETGGRAGSLDQIVCSRLCQGKSRYRHGRVCAELSPTDAAYLAGFWDGEGSFFLHGRKGGSIAFRAVAAGTKTIVMDWIKEVTGIGTAVRHPASNALHAERYDWWVNGDGAESFTRQLLPYLKLKRPQAELALAFQELLRDPAFKADRTWQEEWRQRMRDLNRRGPVASTKIAEGHA